MDYSKNNDVLKKIINKMNDTFDKNPITTYGVYFNDGRLKIYVKQEDEDTYIFSVIPKTGNITKYIKFKRGYDFYSYNHPAIGRDYICVNIEDTDKTLFKKIVYENDSLYNSVKDLYDKLSNYADVKIEDLKAYEAVDEIFGESF